MTLPSYNTVDCAVHCVTYVQNLKLLSVYAKIFQRSLKWYLHVHMQGCVTTTPVKF
jgi:hypothetical protein